MNRSRVRRFLPFGILGMACLATGASAQKPDAGVVLNRMVSAYRSMLSYRDSGTLTQKAGEKTYTAEVKLAMQRPNRYALDIKGEKFNTQVWSDGTSLVAVRPDRKAYTKTKAPAQLFKSDYLAKVDVPAPASRVITYLLENTLRTSDDDFAKSLNQATATGPQPFSGKMAYVLTCRYDEDYDVRLYVTDDDFLLRKAVLVKSGDQEVVQTLGDVEVDKPVPASTFAMSLPENARLVYTLPPLEGVRVASAGPMAKDFTLDTYDGGTVKLSGLKGKVVLLNFFFND